MSDKLADGRSFRILTTYVEFFSDSLRAIGQSGEGRRDDAEESSHGRTDRGSVGRTTINAVSLGEFPHAIQDFEQALWLLPTQFDQSTNAVSYFVRLAKST